MYSETLEDARKLAEEARYRSDFSADESFINRTSSNQQCSPTSSTSSMPLFEGNKLILYNLHNCSVFCAKKLYFKCIVIDFSKFKHKISYDFSNNKQCKLADSENEDKNQSQFTNKGKNSTSEKKNG